MDEAINHYENALKFNKEKGDCLYNLGNAYIIKEKYEEALRSFN